MLRVAVIVMLLCFSDTISTTITSIIRKKVVVEEKEDQLILTQSVQVNTTGFQVTLCENETDSEL